MAIQGFDHHIKQFWERHFEDNSLPDSSAKQLNEEEIEEFKKEAAQGAFVLEPYRLNVYDETTFSLSEFKKEQEGLPLAVHYRNSQWLPKVTSAIHQGKNTAIIIGTGHLDGPSGMIQSLENEGYHVRHVKFNAE